MQQENKVIKIKDIVDNQIPEFILSDNPNFAEFLKQYYTSQEFQGSSIDLAENLISYKNVDSFDNENLISETILTSSVGISDDVINVESTNGWPQEYGLLKIDNEIITYTGITSTSFTGCVRGFSGIDSLSQESNPEFLNFSSTSASSHDNDTKVANLSSLFLKEFFRKIKYQFTPGFEEVEFDSRVNAPNFISKSRLFYQTKGTDECYKILFKVLFGEDVQIIKPDDFTFKPSDDKWTICESFASEVISGNPVNLIGQTLYQDQNYSGTILPASGSIYSVDKFYVKNKVYYKINLFSGYSINLNSTGSIFGDFKETSRTYVVEDIPAGSSVITVDSTIGFDNSGTLIINNNEVSYSNKTSNQFLGCSNITETISTKSEIFGSNYVYGYESGSNSLVKIRLIRVLSDIEFSNNLYATKGDTIKVDNLGNIEENALTKSLIYNLPLTVYSGIITSSLRNTDLEGISLSNGDVRTLYDHKLKNGDIVDLYRFNFDQKIKNSVLVSTNESIPKQYNINISGISSYIGSKIVAKRKLFKSRSSSYPEINNIFTCNIQNSYTDDEYNYIESNGFPNYEINPYERSFSFTTSESDFETLLGSHNFYDGELVSIKNYQISGTFRNFIGIQTGDSLYVKKIDGNHIKLAYSAQNVGFSSFINFSELVNPPVDNSVSGFITSFNLVDSKLYGNQLTSSKLFKKIPKSVKITASENKTIPGDIGLLINGVKIENYKSNDKIYFGKISSINVLNSGENYDLANPPTFEIDNGLDTTTTFVPQLTGKITELVVTNPGFNYASAPIVTILGGGNESVKTEVKMKLQAKEIEFNANSTAGFVNDANDLFQFPQRHNLLTGDKVIYQNLGGTSIGIGTVSTEFLVDNSTYYIINVGAGTSFRLAYTKIDAVENNYIRIREYGTGTQRFLSVDKKLVIDSVEISESNVEFRYKKVFTDNTGMNHYDNTIIIKNHGFSENDEIKYSFTGTTVTGISEVSYYYVHKLNDNEFKLKPSKTSTNYVNFGAPSPNSVYYFEYSPIRAEVSGPLVVDDKNISLGTPATVKPIVLGKITDVLVAPFGRNNYGTESILNLQKLPQVKEVIGSGANLQSLIVDGKIIKVIVKSSGSNYFNSIDLTVEGSGYGAKLEPIIVNGEITSVYVVNPGVGYDSSTKIKINSIGKKLKVSPNLNFWTVNEISKLGETNLSNGAVIGTKYSLFGNTFGVFYLTQNLWSQFNIPTLNPSQNLTRHSPIIGWAYDGCPIYGPDAYTNSDGTGGFRRMVSGYALKSTLDSDRPDTSIYPIGFFIEDYEYVENLGTLDKYNGRFCVTPEFPQGVYAYFCTIKNDRTPVFPYFIGDSYKFTPESDNFNIKYNQNLNLNNLNIVKHTLPYGVENKNNYYEYFYFNKKSKDGEILIDNTSRGKVEDILVFEKGSGYKIGDKISFNNLNTGGFGALAEVSELSGVGISSVFSTTSNLFNVSLINERGSIVGIASTNHNLIDGNFVKITGISSSIFSYLEGYKKISVSSFESTLSEYLPSESITGIVTSIKVNSSILNFNVDSLIKIDSETFKVIGLDIANNSINVLRQSGSSNHNLGTSVTLSPNTFSFEYDGVANLPNKNEIYYFNPSQSVSVGISTAVGAGNTLSILPLGFGVSNTQFIPNGQIFLPNHKFTNGEKVVYEPGQTSIVVSGVGNLSNIPNLYVVKINENVIGLTSSINNPSNLLLYTSAENNYLHKFTTNRNVVSSNITVSKSVVSTAQTHGLSISDKVYLNIISGITTTYNVTYNSSTAKLLINSQNNPEIVIYENETLIFDLSSLSISGRFKLYTDENFTNEYLGNQENGIEVVKTSNTLKFSPSPYTPNILYYNLESSSDIFSDINVVNFNRIIIKRSLYNNQISGITTVSDYSFEVNYPIDVENRVYTSNNSTLSYSVTSSNIEGPINKVKIISKGNNYQKLPKISSISGNGYGANLIPISDSIGKILNYSTINNEFLTSSDYTLKPFSNSYSSVFVYDNYKVDSLRLIERGANYLSAPKLQLYSIENQSIVPEFSADVIIKNGSVDEIIIINSGFGLKSSDTKAIFTDNNNGIRVLGLSTSTGSNGTLVTLTLETPLSGFTTSTPLPISIGDQIFVEGISAINGKYNSSDYDYKFFNVVGIQTAYGSQNAAQVQYEITGPSGIFVLQNTLNNNAYVVNSNILPKVEVILTENIFYSGEEIANSNIISNTKNDPITNLIKVKNPNNILIQNQIQGKYSLSKGKVSRVENYKTILNSNISVNRKLGWKSEQGQLSSFAQKLPDNDYYQKFSYSLKSKKPMSEWESIVSDISHVSGYKKFGDLSVESTPSGITSITSVDSSNINISLNSYVDINTINDFDLVVENVDDYAKNSSDIIKFNSKVLTNYLLSKENLVIPVDDISSLFETDIPITPSILFDQITSSEIVSSVLVKYLFFVQSTDSLFGNFILPQFFELLVARNGNNVNLTSYSYYEDNDLGKVFAETVDSNTMNIYYAPRSSFNSLSIRAFREDTNFNIGVNTVRSYGYTTNVAITTQFNAEVSPTQKILYSIPISESTAGTLFVGISDNLNNVQSYSEMAFLYNSGTVESNLYSQNELSGIGTVGFSTSGSNIIITYDGISGVGVTVYGNLTLIKKSSVGSTTITEGATRLNSSGITGTYTANTPQPLVSIPIEYGASNFGIEVTKTVGITTQKSFIILNSVHYFPGNYLNNINYSMLGNVNDLEFDIVLDNPSSSYILNYVPNENANYSIKFFEKSILHPQI